MATDSDLSLQSVLTEKLVLFVNGKRHEIHNPDPEKTLLQFLRNDLGLTGTKLGCGEGGCGSCTVMISRIESTTTSLEVKSTNENESDSIQNLSNEDDNNQLNSNSKDDYANGGIVDKKEKVKSIRHTAATSCLVRLCSLHGCAITTVEGVGSTNGQLNIIQECIANANGSQCGFCTPGFVMSAYTLLRNNCLPSMSEMEAAIAGNLCRCTGYRPILDGLKKLTRDYQCEMNHKNGGEILKEAGGKQCLNGFNSSEGSSNNGVTHSDHDDSWFECPMGDNCCKNQKSTQSHIKSDSSQSNKTSVNNSNNNSSDDKDKVLQNNETLNTHEYIYPNELSLFYEKYSHEFLRFKSDRMTWYRPTTIDQLQQLRKIFPTARLVAGGIDVALQSKNDINDDMIFISVSGIAGLKQIRTTKKGIEIGAAVTLSELSDISKSAVEKYEPAATKYFVTFIEMLKLVGSKQIRDMATLGGHIASAGPVSDLNPILQVIGAGVSVLSEDNEQTFINIDDKFFIGSRKTCLKSSDIVISVILPFSCAEDHVSAYKESKKKTNATSNVTAAMRVKLKNSTSVVENVSVSFSGMGSHTKMATWACSQLVGLKWNNDLFEKGRQCLEKELWLTDDTPGGRIEFRNTLISSLFLKFYVYVCLQMQPTSGVVPHFDHSAVSKLTFTIRKSSQIYDKPVAEHGGNFICINKEHIKSSSMTESNSNCTNCKNHASNSIQNNTPHKSLNMKANENRCTKMKVFQDPVGQPLANVAAKLHATGEAIYIDDLPPYRNELHMVLVVSSRAHARIKSVDTSAALAIKGVVDYIDHKDIPGLNVKGHKALDEEIFRADTVTCEGQVIGAILAECKAIARRAANAVVVVYEDLEPILTLERAIELNSYIPLPKRALSRGNVDTAFRTSCDHVTEGSYQVGGQKHFYMETQTCLVVARKENREVEVYASSQSLTTLQDGISKALNVDYNKINCKVKRLGGGFGGKETNSLLIALPAAVAAYKLNRPVRCMLDRDEDMVICGGRHSFLGKYKVGFSSDGILQALDIKLYSNGGYSADLSRAVLEEALLMVENCYRIPHVRAEGFVCKTNLPTSTAFRGFGVPQAILICEQWITEISRYLNMSPIDIREMNLYKEGDITPYNQELVNCPVQQCWAQVMKDSHYKERRLQVDEFNRNNKFKKRGISVTPVKMGISTSTCIDQAGALVHIYRDGSVLVTHGGVEMGQGLHTKMIQVASKALDVPVSNIYINETSIATVPNTSPTSASASSDLNGMAVLNACETLMERLEPYLAGNPSRDWLESITKAYADMVNLSAAGFYKIPDLCYSWETNSGKRFNYYTAGAACSEVEVDCLTGEHSVLRTDIVMDAGRSLNPAIDIGQIEGAFIQGYGYFVLEEVQYSSQGNIQNKGPMTYRLPMLYDIPSEFNVALLKNSDNPRALLSSKGVGEPPLLLSTSIFMAIHDAIDSARRAANMDEKFTLACPATIEQIRLNLPPVSVE